MTRAGLIFAATQLLALVLPAADFFVVPDGDDRNPGTADKPFASIQRAQAAARVRIAGGLTRDLVIELRAGRYTLNAPLIFDHRDSGTERHRVIYAGARGSVPRISGGQKITGWKLLENGLLEAPVGKLRFRELFVNGQRRTWARHPNKEFFRVQKVGNDRRTGFTAQVGALESLGNLAGAELVFLHDWCISRTSIKAFDLQTRYLLTASKVGYTPPFGAMDNFEEHPRYRVENHAAALDEPGEWWLDAVAGVIRYLPLPGETVATLDAIVPVTRRLVEVRGAALPAPRIRNLHFRGLAFEHCAWAPPAAGYASAQATWHEPRDGVTGGTIPIPSAIMVDRAQGCSFTACRFARLGGSGLWIRSDSCANSIEGNHFFEISGNGLMIGDGRQFPPEQTSTDNRVKNNLIEQCGRQYFGAVAIWVGLAQGTRIEHNLIRYHPYTGVSLGWSWNSSHTSAGGNIVAHNHIHHVMEILSDGGGIYTLGRQPDSYLRDNLIHDVPLNLGTAEANGIFMDEGSTGFTVENNLIYRIGKSPVRFHRAGTNLLRGNMLGTAPAVAMLRYNSTDPKKIAKKENRQIRDSSLPSRGDLQAVSGAGLQPSFEAALLRRQD